MEIIWLTADFFAQVCTELSNLKKHITAEEAANLNIETFNGRNKNSCVYGQLTGNCCTKRAVELLNTCAKPFSGHTYRVEEPEAVFVRGLFRLNPYSHLEFLVYNNGKWNAEILAYLKGETETLPIFEK